MKLLEKVYSQTDKVVKYVFRAWTYSDDIVEFSYIDNGSGKDIICVSCQTMCNMGCKFCHCTDYVGTIPVKSLSWTNIVYAVQHIINDLDKKQDTLLISYMGCGEPLNLNYEDDIILSMKNIMAVNKSKYKTVRFALATSLPARKVNRFFGMTCKIKENNLPVKLHLSLHYTNGTTRAEWMPNSLDIKSSIAACKFYQEYTKNAVEIHYTLIEGLNDDRLDAVCLNYLLEGCDFNVKVITYNEKDTIDYKRSKSTEIFCDLIELPVEVYTPPGIDVGSSCGQFLFGTYQKYKGKH